MFSIIKILFLVAVGCVSGFVGDNGGMLLTVITGAFVLLYVAAWKSLRKKHNIDSKYNVLVYTLMFIILISIASAPKILMLLS